MQFHLFRDANYEIIGYRKFAAFFSIALILIGIVALIINGGFKMSIDFAGGTIVQVKFQNPVEIAELRKEIDKMNLSSLEISRFGAKDEVLIRFSVLEDKESISAEKMFEDFFAKQYTQNPAEIRRIEHVGPKIGRELTIQAFWAIIFSLVGILIYVTLRFQFKFAVAAVVALFHDVFCTLAFFAILNKEVSLPFIAALLTIVGYSINDTIVIFDRIRENLRSIRKQKLDRIVNNSINQTLSRTIITSGTTMLAILALVVYGSEVTFDFSLALFFGIVIGTYSSIYVASPVVVAWQTYTESQQKNKTITKR